jgi:hypothetical protein
MRAVTQIRSRPALDHERRSVDYSLFPYQSPLCARAAIAQSLFR